MNSTSIERYVVVFEEVASLLLPDEPPIHFRIVTKERLSRTHWIAIADISKYDAFIIFLGNGDCIFETCAEQSVITRDDRDYFRRVLEKK